MTGRDVIETVDDGTEESLYLSPFFDDNVNMLVTFKAKPAKSKKLEYLIKSLDDDVPRLLDPQDSLGYDWDENT